MPGLSRSTLVVADGIRVPVVVQSPSRVLLSVPRGLQQARPPCPSPSLRVCLSLCSLHRGCYPVISFSDALFCPQSFPASGTFPVSYLFASGIRWPKYCSFSFSTSPSSDHSGLISLKIDWFDLLLSKGLSGVVSSTTVWRHQYFGFLLPLQSSSLHPMWSLGRP